MEMEMEIDMENEVLFIPQKTTELVVKKVQNCTTLERTEEGVAKL
jgi:predicted HAD superfamily hydrolase